MKVWVDYTNGIDHPLFYADCPRCGSRHGPYTTFAAIPSICRACSDRDAAELRAYIQQLIEEQERVPAQDT
jgi:hypothetical protein